MIPCALHSAGYAILHAKASAVPRNFRVISL